MAEHSNSQSPLRVFISVAAIAAFYKLADELLLIAGAVETRHWLPTLLILGAGAGLALSIYIDKRETRSDPL